MCYHRVQLPLFLSLLAALAGPAAGQVPARKPTLEERVRTLERVALALDSRVKELEAALSARPTDATAQTRVRFEDLDGKAVIIADDGEFLGLVSSNAFASKSILNDVGSHGGTVASKSIFNDVGRYGGDISQQSPWNEIAARPPKVFLDEKFVGFLTRNKAKTPRIDPYALVAFLKSKQ